MLFLQIYSPDCLPIEETFLQAQSVSATAGRRTHEALQEAIEQDLETVTAQDVLGWFTHCGYLSTQASNH